MICHRPKPAVSLRQAGFTLLELLVALSIMGMALALIYRSVGDSARNAHDLVLQQRAMWLAESVLASRNSVPPQGWQESGESDGMGWEVQSSPQATPLSGDKVIPLLRIDLAVHWEASRGPAALRVSTLLPQHELQLPP
ncbi:MAG: type II secretion system protein [Hydrogenophaga sp.]|nr:type II secretion system protein [Hydrogenophaga sp.]